MDYKQTPLIPISSVQFSHSVMSDSLRPHEPQHARPPCPSPIPGVYPNSCPSSRWCNPAISSSVVPFSACPQALPASGSFPMSQLFAWGGPKHWSFSFSISPSSEHPGLMSFRMDWWDLLAVHHWALMSIDLWPILFHQYLYPVLPLLHCFEVKLRHYHFILNYFSMYLSKIKT